MTRTPKFSRIALWSLPAVVVVAGFLSSALWIKRTFGDTATLIAAAIAATFVMGYSIYLSARTQRSLDEVQRASMGFAAKWGPPLGHIVFVLLLIFPPVPAAVADLVSKVAAEPGETVDPDVVALVMTIAFMGTVMLQLVGTIVMNAVWWTRRR